VLHSLHLLLMYVQVHCVMRTPPLLICVPGHCVSCVPCYYICVCPVPCAGTDTTCSPPCTVRREPVERQDRLLRGEAVQAEPMKSKLKAPGTKRLKPKYDNLLLSSAFKCFQIQVAPLQIGRHVRDAGPVAGACPRPLFSST
jgi:hypothetical protein